MLQLPQQLLGAALRMKWERGHTGDAQATQTLTENLPGFHAEEYAEAYARAKELDALAWRLADEYFASRKASAFTDRILAKSCPGFAPADYADAWNNNLIWASK